jgi:ferredoxin-NADP reductase
MGWTTLVVSEKIEEADETCSLRFALPPSAVDSFNYEPGQFVHVRKIIDGTPVERSYSLSSAPGIDPFFQLTIKRIQGGLLSPILVEELSVGDELELSTPQGRFFDADPNVPHHYLLVGAGSGVTPLFSIMKWLLARERSDEVTLVFSSRRESSIIFRGQLDALVNRYPARLRVIHILTQPSGEWSGERGRLDRERLVQVLAERAPAGDLPEIAYLCGPESFMDEATIALEARGLERGNIRRESFAVADAISAADLDNETTVRILPEGYEKDAPAAEACKSLSVRIDGTDIEIISEPQETILAALLREGIDAPFSCQEGTCLSCICSVKEGAVRMRRHELIGLTPDDLGEGVVLACLSKPDSERVRVSFEDN